MGWTLRRTFGALPALLASLATVGLPWLLALRLLGGEWSEQLAVARASWRC